MLLSFQRPTALLASEGLSLSCACILSLELLRLEAGSG
jgi:hypothetical protein